MRTRPKDIVNARMRSRLTREELSEKLEVSVVTIWRWETGRSTPQGASRRALERWMAKHVARPGDGPAA